MSTELTPQGDLTRDIETLFLYVQALLSTTNDLNKFIGIKTTAEISSLDTSSYTGGEWVIDKQIPTIKIWSATLEAWV